MEIDPVTAARFWAKVARAGPDDCWEWRANAKPQGYGLFKIGGVQRKATHVALAIDGRPRIGLLHALHSCDNPSCVNPRHLRWGSPRQNTDDKVTRGRCSHSGPGEGARRGEVHPFARLTAEAVLSIRQSDRGYKSLAREYGVERTTIRSIKKGKTWRHLRAAA